jgi:uncharacterized pyridoxal phosphate-containing UPF0001 family protein
MLGKIQSNKIDTIVKIFSYVHSLDSKRNAIKFSESEKKFGKKLDYLSGFIGNVFVENNSKLVKITKTKEKKLLW